MARQARPTRSTRSARRRALGARVLAAAAACMPLACTPLEDATIADTAAADTLPTGDAEARVGPRDVFAVEVARHADSAVAVALRDSLAAAGWSAYVRTVRQMDTLPPFRVRVMPTARVELARLVAAGFDAAGTRPLLVNDVAVPASPGVSLVAVNRAGRGDATRLRWASTGDRAALLVVEEVSVASGAPVPDAFLYVADGGPVVVQRDSVWDVTISPDWRRLAYGRAYVVSAEGRDSLSIRGWADVAARTNIQIHLIREGAFRIGGEQQILAVTQPVVESTHPDSLRDQSLIRIVSTQVPLLGGWRVRWTPDGRTLAVGLAPRAPVRDDSPASSYLGVDPGTGLFYKELPARGLHSPAWTRGPAITAATRLDGDARRIEIAGGAVESRDGWVVVRGEATGGAPVVLGPGTALTATRSGRFVLALVPVPGARDGAPTVQALVYRVH